MRASSLLTRPERKLTSVYPAANGVRRMARPRQRVRLEDGLRLDLNKLVREGFWPRGNASLTVGTQWTSNRQGVLASALITLQKHEEDRGSLKIVMIGKFEQRLDLIAEPRHFGGRQWYFRCPITGGKCSVVWLPPGATRFCSRQAWGKQVAYSHTIRGTIQQSHQREGEGQIAIDW